MIRTLPPDDRGFHYGDGLFETIRVGPGGAPLLPLHRARMEAGAARLGIRFPTASFEREAGQLPGLGPGVVKLVLTRGSGGRGYAAPVGARPRLVAFRYPLPVRAPALAVAGLELGVCATRLSEARHLAGMKHLNRLDQVLARTEVQQAGWDEGLMLDALGRPQELTAMNLFARFGDRLWTPRWPGGGVAGVLKQWCLAALEGSRLSLDARPLPLRRLREADEVFAGNSVAGILPVRKLALWTWPVGELTRDLQERFERLFANP